MGCGGSSLDPERAAVAAKFPPRIRHRFEEIKRRRNADAFKATLSKKKLLKEGDQSASQDSADDKSLPSSPEESLRKARVAPEPESFKEEDYNKQDKIEERILEEAVNMNAEKYHAVEEETDVEKEGKNLEESEEEEEEEAEMVTNFGNGYVGYACPSSPSFRVYCTETLEPINDDSKEVDIDKKEKSQRGDTRSVMFASANCNEGSERKVREKEGAGKKERRQRKRKSNAVRNLVTSCYHPSCTGHHNTSLLAQKAAAA